MSAPVPGLAGEEMEPRHRCKVRGTPSRVRTVRSARADRCAFCLDPAAQPRPFPENILRKVQR